ncbi:MAG: hypothetical protein ACLFUS_08975 [Candidatus Sumerlaeia bacterium]
MASMVFRNYGGHYQLRIEKPEDLQQVAALDEGLWAATSGPANGLQCDPVFLKYMDNDSNGRIRVDEVKTAVDWLLRMMKGYAGIGENRDVLRVEDIDESHAEGQKLRSTVAFILGNLAVEKQDTISLAQVRDSRSILDSSCCNGDGIIPPEAADDPALADFIRLIMDHIGSESDAGGKKGITSGHLQQFLDQARGYLGWIEEGQLLPDERHSDIMPWGHSTEEAWSAIAPIKDKMEQYFALCRLMRLDARTQDKAGLRAVNFEDLDFSDTAAMQDSMAKAPLAQPSAEGVLDLEARLNPYWEKALKEFREKVLTHFQPNEPDRISEASWSKIRDDFAGYEKWLQRKPDTSLASLGTDQLKKLLSSGYADGIQKLVQDDLAVADEIKQIQNVEKLILYQRWMMDFANSFINLSHLFDPEHNALFEKGELIIDGRKITFAVQVDDLAKHKNQAKDCFMHVLYIEVTGRRSPPEKFIVALPVTSGESVGLYVEKRGVFIDTTGKIWDARIVDIIQNPVSLAEAFKAPFQRIGRYFMEQFEKFSKAQQAKMESAVTAPQSSTATRDLLLAGSVGLAALGSSLAFITKTVATVEIREVLMVLLGIAVLVFVPIILVAWLRLRKRDMTMLLESSGWAINLRLRISPRLGRLFTRDAELPKNAHKENRDLVVLLSKKWAPRRIKWLRVLLFSFIGVALIYGYMLYKLLENFE